MFLEDIRKDFYNVIAGKRVLLLVNFDIDAICACKILQYLFRCDNVVYTLVPVQGIKDLQRAYEENSEEVKYVLLINCGGSIDIVEFLQPSEDVIFFVADSHRPTDVCNVYSSSQVRLIQKAADDEDIPSFEDIFREDDESDDEEMEDEDDGDDDESPMEKRRRLGEEAILKRRERRVWMENRHRILFDYTQFSFYGRSTAMLMFELAWKLSKDSSDLLWWAIIGVTEQLILNKVESQQYVLETGNLQSHVSRLNHQAEGDPNHNVSGLKITFEKDLHLALYRHWTVVDSIRHSIYPACKLRLWTLKGDGRLQELLCDIGFPLVQCKQKFSSMDLILRQEFRDVMESHAEKYGLSNIIYASFLLQYGFKNRFSASDVVYGMLGLLESSGKDSTSEDCFLEALDSLSRSKRSVLEKGIERSKKLLTSIFKQVHTSLEMNQIISAGPFVYIILQEWTQDARIFSHPHSLTMLAQFALRAYVATSRNKKAPSLPLLASAPAPINQGEGMCLVVGIPPVSEESPRNFFGKAFEQAAEKTHSIASCDYFDTSLVLLKTEDRTKFFDALTVLLG